MCGGIHGSPWDIFHRRVGPDRHIGLTCVVAHMEFPGISFIEQWDGIDT